MSKLNLFVALALLLSIASAETIYAITSSYSLISFDSATPATISNYGAISGVNTGHTIRSADFRPNGGGLWVISTNPSSTANTSVAQLYTLNVATAALTAVGQVFTIFSASTEVHIDFNPVVDRIRLVTGDGYNARLNPVNGSFVANDTSLTWNNQSTFAGTPVRVANVAYTNNVNGTTVTTLLAIEFNTQYAVTIGTLNGAVSPNGGVLYPVGAVGINFTLPAGLDVSGTSGVIYASNSGGQIYSASATSGNLTLLGNTGQALLDISVFIASTNSTTGVVTTGATVTTGVTTGAVNTTAGATTARATTAPATTGSSSSSSSTTGNGSAKIGASIALIAAVFAMLF